MKFGIAFDLVPFDRVCEGPDDRYEEFDKPETVEAIAEVLRGLGHDVVLLGDGREFLESILADPPDFVWNLAEGEGISRSREARVPAALEILGIPYTGSDPLTLAAALDKHVAKQIVRDRVHTPSCALIPSQATRATVRDDLNRLFRQLPTGCLVIGKPAFEGSSKGIRGSALASTVAEAEDLWARLAADYQQPILLEEFIEGDEVTVGIVGNGPDARVLGVMRVLPRRPTERFVYSLEVKRDWKALVDYEAPAKLSREVNNRIREAAVSCYTALGCRDLARIDFRVRAGVPYFIEANPLPGLSPTSSDLVILAHGHGIGYEELIREIHQAAQQRIGRSPAGVTVP